MPATPADLPADDYILGRTSEEYQRLRRQARLWEPTTARVLDQVGIQPGMRCLDVGCGPGEVLRLLLHHLRDPVAMLRKLGRWTRPGGLVVVQDYDVRTVDVWPGLRTWDEFERVIYGVYQQTGRDLRFGHKLPLHFVAAGLGEPDGTDVAGLLLSPVEIGQLYQGVYRSMLPAALRFGLTTEADSQAFLGEIVEVAAGRAHVGLSPLLVSAWKRREQPEP